MAQFTFQGTLTNAAIGEQNVAVELDIPSPVADVRTVDLSSGDNTITVPSGTRLIILTPPTTNSHNLTLKGHSGDTGIGIRNAEPNFIPYRTGTVIVNAGGSVAGCIVKFL